MRGFHYGVREQHDVLAAVRYAVGRGPARVVLCGTSVGGASVVYAATTDAAHIIGVICENPVAHPEARLLSRMPRHSLTRADVHRRPRAHCAGQVQPAVVLAGVPRVCACGHVHVPVAHRAAVGTQGDACSSDGCALSLTRL